jgi:hypothetical protein
MVMRDAEFDRFGPWVIEISEKDPPPPLFVPFLTRKEEPLFSVKIPRKITRRNAEPGMNLYDYLVTLYKTDIVILERVGEEVREHVLSYVEIQYLSLREELLKGTLQVGLPGRVFDLPFNTTSAATMQRLTDMVRARYAAAERLVTVDSGAPGAVPGLSYFFDNLLTEELARQPRFQFLAAQPDAAVADLETNALRKFVVGAMDKTLMESLHFCYGRELKVISRGRTFKYRWQNIYGTARTTVPVGDVTGVRWEGDGSNAAVVHLQIETRAGGLSYGFLADNPLVEGYRRFLESL